MNYSLKTQIISDNTVYALRNYSKTLSEESYPNHLIQKPLLERERERENATNNT